VVLLLVFVIRGLLRGTIAQVFAFCGLLIGIWAASWVSQWVGGHWHDARPALVYGALRWIVAVLAGMAVASLFQWWGEHVAKATHEGPFGWIDRVVGALVGAAFGLTLVALLALAAVQAPMLGSLRAVAARSVFVPPLLRGGTRLTALPEVVFPGSRWLHGQYVAAEKRIGSSRSH
jgi:uncharacterized membrane protein required for colicin V production